VSFCTSLNSIAAIEILYAARYVALYSKHCSRYVVCSCKSCKLWD